MKVKWQFPVAFNCITVKGEIAGFLWLCWSVSTLSHKLKYMLKFLHAGTWYTKPEVCPIRTASSVLICVLRITLAKVQYLGVKDVGQHQETMAHWIIYAGFTWAHRDWNGKHKLCIGLHQVLCVCCGCLLGGFVGPLTVGDSMPLLHAIEALLFLLDCLVQPWAEGSHLVLLYLVLSSLAVALEFCSFLKMKRKVSRSGGRLGS